MDFTTKVYNLCKKVPKGRVTTYKILAEKLSTKAYRAVGMAMKRNPYAPKVPCHRVVSASGHVGGFKGKTKGKAIKDKILMLEKEGVKVKNKKIVDFEKRLYRF
jgi:methylated-DNA-[protein]-cysteine S-methyltransferase